MLKLPKDGVPKSRTFANTSIFLVRTFFFSRFQLFTYSCIDINTRSGLKKVHAKFDKISQKLDYAFSEAKKVRNERVMEDICGIWGKMCHDALLRNKLFKQGT